MGSDVTVTPPNEKALSMNHSDSYGETPPHLIVSEPHPEPEDLRRSKGEYSGNAKSASKYLLSLAEAAGPGNDADMLSPCSIATVVSPKSFFHTQSINDVGETQTDDTVWFRTSSN